MLLKNTPESKCGKKWLSIVYFKSMSCCSIGTQWCLCPFWHDSVCRACFAWSEPVIFVVAIFQVADETAWGRLKIPLWNAQQDFSKMNQDSQKTLPQNQKQEKTIHITSIKIFWHLGNAQMGLKWRANNCLKKKIKYGQETMHRCKIPPTKSNYLSSIVFPCSCVSSFYNGRRTTNHDSLPWSTLGDTGVTLNYFNCRK